MDENRDKEMMRNQLIAVVLMTLLFVAWFKWFVPPPQERKPTATPQSAQTQRQEPAESPAKEKKTAEPAKDLWPGLPEIPEIADPAAEEIHLADEYLELTFTRIGARLKKAKIILGKGGRDSVQLVPEDPDTPDTEAVYPFGLRFSDPGLGEELDRRRFEAEPDPSGKAVAFILTIPGKAVIRKRFSFEGAKHLLRAQIEYQNLEPAPQVIGMDQTPAYFLNWGPNVSSGDEEMGVKQAFVWRLDGRVSELPTANMTPDGSGPFRKVVHDSEWIAIKSAYFIVAFKPEFEGAIAEATGDPKRFRVGYSVPRFETPPNGVQSHAVLAYLGPSEQRMLAQGWDTLPGVLRFFSPTWDFMDKFAKLLLKIMNWSYAVIPNYGVAIIVLTILVRLAMYPLTLKSMKSMKKMQMLGPEMEELKSKYGDDPQELNKKMMELYRERGVNPVGGCLPMFLQMPVFIALYRMLWCAYELRGAPFFGWITDLSQPDRMFHIAALHNVPLIGIFEHFNLLPFLMGASMLLNQKMMPVGGAMQNSQQKIIMNIMPVFFTFICYNMASGLNLYIFTSTVLGMVQQKFTHVGEVELKTRKAAPKKQHFYTAAQAKKRQLAKEMKQEKKRKPARGENADGKNR